MKNWLILGLLMVVFLKGEAQQDPMFSQYMFNKLVLNPAYAGSREQLSASAIFRQQWSGWEGAPRTQSFGIHTPTTDLRHGFGLHFYNDKVGFTSNFLGSFSYAYRIPVKKGHLALGMTAGLNSYWVRLSEVETWQQGDVAFANGGDFTRTLFMAGPGVFYSGKRWYLGASVPNIVPNRLYDPYYEQLVAEKSRHVYAMGGIVLKMGPWLQFRPSFLMKYTTGIDPLWDLSAAFFIKERIWIGGSYRPGNALVGMMELYLSPNLRLGYAYDYVTSSLSNYTSGSHEFSLGIDFGFQKTRMVSPKLF